MKRLINYKIATDVQNIYKNQIKNVNVFLLLKKQDIKHVSFNECFCEVYYL